MKDGADVVLAYDVHGDGEPLLLIHGIGHRRQGWDPLIPILAQRYQVITIDLPGFGDSPWVKMPKGHARPVLRKAIEDTLAELGHDKVHVAGNSLGGLIALEVGATGKALSVTALSPAGFHSNDLDFLYINGLFQSVMAITTLARPVSGPIFDTNLGKRLSLSWLRAQTDKYPGDVARLDAAGLVRSQWNVRRLLRNVYQYEGLIDCPVTIAWAEKDRVLLPYQARRAQRVLPNAELVWLENCGHVPMWDEPELCAETIIETCERASAALTTTKKKVTTA